MHIPFKPVLAAAAIAQAFPAFAADPAPQSARTLNEITVTGTHKTQKLGEEKIRRKTLDKLLVNDEHDLVRYDPGISVVEGGRAGSNGFTIRGVDKDRVAINVDGLAQAESRSSEAFQELFGAYGNFNANRNTSEPENFSEVTITKGADSLKSGSGALGGAVNYQTKSASDYVSEDKPYHLGIKGGSVGKNSQKFSSITAAGRLFGLDALLVYTRRFGKETKNRSTEGDIEIKNDGYVYNPTDTGGPSKYLTYVATGVARSRPDPQEWVNKSTLFKLGYNFNDRNRIGWIFEDSRTDRFTNELSNLWTGTTTSVPTGDYRHRQDVSYRRRTGVEYKNELEHGPWDSLKLRYDKQRIDMNTWTWDIPKNYDTNGINGEVYHSFRHIRQNTAQWTADFEKQLDFSKAVWAAQYGLGGGRGDNANSDYSYFAKLYAPKILASNQAKITMLIENRSKYKFAYWNNAFHLGGNDRFRLNAGIRYDKNSSSAKDDPKYTTAIRGQIPHLGSERAHAGFSYGTGFDWRFTKHLHLLAKYSTDFGRNLAAVPTPRFLPESQPKPESRKSQKLGIGSGGQRQGGQLQALGLQNQIPRLYRIDVYGRFVR